VNNLFDEIYNSDLSSDCIFYKQKKLTYGDFFSQIEKITSFLNANKLTVGSRIGLRTTDSLELLIMYYGCFAGGFVPVPIPYKDKDRVNGALETSKAQIVINSIDDLEASELIPVPMFDISSEEALVIFTSGTTSSKLKGVRISKKGVSNICEFMNRKMGVNAKTHECVAASLDHAFGFGRCHSILKAGGKLSLVGTNNPLSNIFDAFENHGCNAISAPPSILSSLLIATDGDLGILSNQVKWVQSGAMRFDVSFRKRLISALPRARIFLHYGLSEAMRVTFLEINKHLSKLHTEGTSSEGVEIAILDHENKMIQSSSREGSIAIRGTNLCLGYLDTELWESNLHEGWFVTSDTGMIDDDGFLIFCGRSDDVINSNGVLIHPDEIESKIRSTFPKLVFSIVGIQDELNIKDSIICLCVQGNTIITLKDLKKALSSTDIALIPHKVVNLDSLPRTRSGKVNRLALGKLVANLKT